MKIKNLKQGVKVISFVIVLLFLFYKTRGADLEVHNETLYLVRQSKNLDILVNDAITKLRYGLVSNYDSLPRNWNELKRIHKKLDRELHKNVRYSKYWEKYKKSISDKEILIEEFKTTNSFFNNSVSYFPLITTRLITKNSNLQKELNQLLRLTLLYNSTGEKFLKSKVTQSIQQLQKKDNRDLKIVLLHANVIVSNKELIDKVVSKLTDFILKQRLDKFSEEYSKYYNFQQQSKYKYQVALYLLCIALFAYVVYIVVELRSQSIVLSEANAKLKEASRHKSEFLANMSHELRTPINAIIGYTSLTSKALNGKVADVHQKSLGRVEQAARTLLHLINDILDFSKIEAGKLNLLIENFSFREVIDECIITTEGLLLGQSIEFRKNIEDLPFIKSDFTKVKQILVNLLSNAVKFTQKGYIELSIKVLTEDQALCIQIKDTGCGIPEEKIASIFESFKQVDSSIQKRFGGTGLGLAITKSLCEMLGIKIDLESKEGKGTSFFLIIPFEQSNSQKITLEKAKLSFAQQPSDISEENIKASVLCLTDSKTVAELQKYLQDLPLEVCPLNSIEECTVFAQQKIVWAIVIGPNNGVFTKVSQLKTHPQLKKVPIIVCSADIANSGISMNTLEYLTKPFDLEQLIEVMLRISKHKKENVLIVEDQPAQCELYQKVLGSAGYSPYVTNNGKEALHFLETQPLPQTIILDLLMPKMNGFEFLSNIQRHSTWSKIPIIVCTSKDLSKEEKELLQEGTKALIKKDPLEENFQDKLKSCLDSVCLGDVKSILVVDDHPMNLDLVASIFNNNGYTVYKESSGHSGIETAQKIKPDVILMDLAMPQVDGFKATKMLKESPETRDITIIACSAFTTKDFKEKAYDAGCEGYITKPIEPNHLVKQVKKLVLLSRIRRKLSAASLS
ncbi:response regulator [Candidatus Uabimicrobium sp. HlEnr_7]|uniref:response regulator n=1 Tax=Candidatus Uabimicrobium helgolandensis TaxID=3095367 RepID=UPI0035562275